MTQEFIGFLRKDGGVGIRNYVAVISAIDSLNPIAAKIVDLVKGTVLVSDLFGRKLAGVNHAVRIQSLAGMALNPNVGAVLVVSLHMPSALTVAEPISAAGMDVEIVAFQDQGSTIKAIEAGVRIAVKMVKKCSAQRRQPVPVSSLILGVECGGSDFSSGISGNPAIGVAADRLMDEGGTVILSETPEIIGAEHILARRAVNQAVGDKLLRCVKDIEALAEMAGDGRRLPRWPEIPRDGQRWPQMGADGRRWAEMAGDGRRWPQLGGDGLRWPQLDGGGRRYYDPIVAIVTL